MEKSFQGRKTKEDELFFPRENFSLSAIRQLSAERSEARQSDQGKGKVLPRKEKFVRDCTFLPWIHDCHHWGTHFFALQEFVQP